MALTNAALLDHTPPALRGRLMSVYLLDRGLQLLGTMIVGFSTDMAGVMFALGVMGVACLSFALLVVAFVP